MFGEILHDDAVVGRDPGESFKFAEVEIDGVIVIHGSGLIQRMLGVEKTLTDLRVEITHGSPVQLAEVLRG
jgi:hypothetical protein